MEAADLTWHKATINGLKREKIRLFEMTERAFKEIDEHIKTLEKDIERKSRENVG